MTRAEKRVVRAAIAKMREPSGPFVSVQLQPTQKMLRAGARRLLRFEDDLSDRAHDPLQWAAAINEAERVWRSMWLEAALDAERAALAKRRKE